MRVERALAAAARGSDLLNARVAAVLARLNCTVTGLKTRFKSDARAREGFLFCVTKEEARGL